MQRLFWSLSLIFVIFAPLTAYALDALQVLPTRFVLEKQRSAELTLINKGSSLGKYRILLRNMRTDENGAFEAVETAKDGELFADKLIRFSPRAVDIGPGAFQKVRLMVRKPKNLAAGEYRTHMVFQSVPSQAPSVLDESKEVKVEVAPIIEISIPVIVRHGQLSASVELQTPTIQDEALMLSIHRQGNRSLYGDINVFAMKDGQPDIQLGFLKGVSVYVPNKIRKIAIPLNFPSNFTRADSKYLVQFKEDATYGGDQKTEASF